MTHIERSIANDLSCYILFYWLIQGNCIGTCTWDRRNINDIMGGSSPMPLDSSLKKS